MKMTFRWYGEGNDPISLKQIKQIPGMSGLMGLLDYKAAGEVWTEEEIKPSWSTFMRLVLSVRLSRV
ncbi:MAG: mannonate dehydratase [Lachnospiraceae bacterium]